jgi:hypothetical protein
MGQSPIAPVNWSDAERSERPDISKAEARYSDGFAADL